VGNLIQAVVEEIKENICWGLYIAETADCGGLYPDDWNYDGCMETAWLNLERCKHKLGANTLCTEYTEVSVDRTSELQIVHRPELRAC